MRALIKIYFIPMSIAFLLYGCGGVKEKIGLIKKAPDEFQVYESKPLSVPPNFELRPPSEGAIESEDDNKGNFFPDKDETDEKLTLSDEILLIEVGEKEIKGNMDVKFLNISLFSSSDTKTTSTPCAFHFE